MTPLWLTEKWWRPVLGGMAAWAALFVVSLLTAPDVFNAPWTPVVAREIGPEQLDLAVRLQAALLGVHLLLGIWFALPAAFSPRRGSFLLGFISSLGVALAFYFYEIGMRPALLADTATRGDGVLAGWYQLVIHEPLWGFAFLAPVGLMLVYRAIRERSAKEALALAVVGAVTWRVFFYIDPIPSPVAAASPEHPDIVLIAADSLRPDFLGCYGDPAGTTPRLDSLCANGTVFEEAFVPLARSLPSWASILSGRAPWDHGVRHRYPTLSQAALDETLPRWMLDAGYQTAVFADAAGEIFTRMDTGFETVQAPPYSLNTQAVARIVASHRFLLAFADTIPGRQLYPNLAAVPVMADADLLTDTVLRFLSHPTDRPRFVVVYYTQTRAPFAATYPYYGRFTEDTYVGPYAATQSSTSRDAEMTSNEAERVRARYRDCVHQVDDQIGRLVDAVTQRRGGEKTVFLVTSDHGENFETLNDDPSFDDRFRRNDALRVPLILYGPESVPKGLRVPGLVSTTDIAPTLASAAGAEFPEGLNGQDLYAMIRAENSGRSALIFESGLWQNEPGSGKDEERRIAYPGLATTLEVLNGDGPYLALKPEYTDIVNIAKHRMVYDGRYKLIYIPTVNGIRWELYDLLYDPMETNDVVTQDTEAFRRLARFLFEQSELAPNTEVRRGYVLPVTPTY
ncbi:MAG: sulfatase [Deltaproteobacteria bacterium]|nr:sulfatase [Deltaproteobacteria bacterium]